MVSSDQAVRELPTRTALGPVLALALVLLLTWSFWGLALRPLIPTQSEWVEAVIDSAARTLFWLVPSGIYLWRYWGWRWHEPFGFGFPLGRPQLTRTVIIVVTVAALLVLGTALQRGTTIAALLGALATNAKFDVRAPIFEELVFRGLIVSELMNWTHDHSEDLAQVRARFWGAQLFAALVFLLMHWPWWWSHHGLETTLARSPPMLVTGLILGIVFATTRSIWGCIALHWLNNELSALA